MKRTGVDGMILGLALAGLCGVGAVQAQASDDIIKDTAGRYRISNGKASCTLTLTTEGSIGGYEAKVPKACGKSFPELGEGAVWNLADGGLSLSDTMRHRIVTFQENEGAGYDPVRIHGKTWALKALDVAPDLTPAQQMTGDWAVFDAPDKLCTYRFASNAAGTAGTAKAAPGCSAAWSAKGVVKWSRKGDALTLLDAAGKPVAKADRTESITFSHGNGGPGSFDLMKQAPGE